MSQPRDVPGTRVSDGGGSESEDEVEELLEVRGVGVHGEQATGGEVQVQSQPKGLGQFVSSIRRAVEASERSAQEVTVGFKRAATGGSASGELAGGANLPEVFQGPAAAMGLASQVRVPYDVELNLEIRGARAGMSKAQILELVQSRSVVVATSYSPAFDPHVVVKPLKKVVIDVDGLSLAKTSELIRLGGDVCLDTEALLCESVAYAPPDGSDPAPKEPELFQKHMQAVGINVVHPGGEDGLGLADGVPSPLRLPLKSGDGRGKRSLGSVLLGDRRREGTPVAPGVVTRPGQAPAGGGVAWRAGCGGRGLCGLGPLYARVAAFPAGRNNHFSYAAVVRRIGVLGVELGWAGTAAEVSPLSLLGLSWVLITGPRAGTGLGSGVTSPCGRADQHLFVCAATSSQPAGGDYTQPFGFAVASPDADAHGVLWMIVDPLPPYHLVKLQSGRLRQKAVMEPLLIHRLPGLDGTGALQVLLELMPSGAWDYPLWTLASVADTAWVKAQLQQLLRGGLNDLMIWDRWTSEAFYRYLRICPELTVLLYRQKAGGPGRESTGGTVPTLLRICHSAGLRVGGVVALHACARCFCRTACLRARRVVRAGRGVGRRVRIRVGGGVGTT
ncbi:hypothetical protein BC829DRAFT_446128 [Chytridium lagenaria]|nr:hypothetical protein BC829DRAFT_446128 [Chytridium lagenaria]